MKGKGSNRESVRTTDDGGLLCYNAAMPVDVRLTYEDFCRIPNDGKRHEIIDGEHIVSPSPLTLHQRVVVRLASYLFTFLQSHPLGEVFVAPLDIVFSDFDVVEPDLLYVSKQRSGIVTRKNVQGAPDLVVEVLSESTADIDRTNKLKLYARSGVLEYWIIDAENVSASVYGQGENGLDLVTNLNADDSLASPLLPSFAVALRTLTE